MRVSCPCLNLRFTAELSRRSAKKPAVGFQPDVNRSSPTRKPIRGSRDEAFFVACEEGVVENIVAEHPQLLQIRVCLKVSSKGSEIDTRWNVVYCNGCDTDVYARRDTSSQHLVNISELLRGGPEIESAQLKRQYSSAFKILLLEAAADKDGGASAASVDANRMDAIRTDLDQRSSKHLDDEERATRARIQAYEKVQLDALRAQKMRVEQEQLAMFRLLVRSQNADGTDALDEISLSRRISGNSPKAGNSPSHSGSAVSARATPDHAAAAGTGLTTVTADFEAEEASLFLLDGVGDSDDGDDGDDTESEDEGQAPHPFSRSPDFDDIPMLGSSVPIAIPLGTSLRSRGVSGPKDDSALRGGATMVAASMRELASRDRANSLRLEPEGSLALHALASSLADAAADILSASPPR